VASHHELFQAFSMFFFFLLFCYSWIWVSREIVWELGFLDAFSKVKSGFSNLYHYVWFSPCGEPSEFALVKFFLFLVNLDNVSSCPLPVKNSSLGWKKPLLSSVKDISCNLMMIWTLFMFLLSPGCTHFYLFYVFVLFFQDGLSQLHSELLCLHVVCSKLLRANATHLQMN